MLVQHLLAKDIPITRQSLWSESINKNLGAWRYELHQEADRLDQYQKESVRSMSAAGGIMALGCGLGKTMTAVVAAMSVPFGGRCWIVAPLNAFMAWQEFLPLLRTKFDDVRVMSMDSLHRIEPGTPSTGGVVIFDEAHLLGATKARRTKHAMALRLKFDYGLCLTGTLLHGGIVKALTAMNLAVPGLSSFASAWKAADYFKCIETKKMGAQTFTTIAKPRGENLERFKKFLTENYVVSLARTSPTVRQSVSVPEQDLHFVEFGQPWQPVEVEATAWIRAKMAETATIPSAAETRHALLRSGIEAKVDYVLDQLGNDSAVVFAAYLESLEALCTRLDEEGITHVRVDGSVLGDARAEAVRRFQAGEVQVFAGQIVAAGIGTNLYRAHRSFNLDGVQLPATYDQALARTCRRGQTQQCHHYDLVANKMQLSSILHVRDGRSFDASVTEYQDVTRALQGITNAVPPLVLHQSPDSAEEDGAQAN
jgi:SNF2 family DNA or RNA helicase